MSEQPSTLDNLMEMLENQKRTIRAAIKAAREEILQAADKIEDKIEDIDSDEIKMKLMLAKLKAQEEWDELEEKLSDFGGKAKQIMGSTESEAKEAWTSAKEMASNTLEKAADLLKKPKA